MAEAAARGHHVTAVVRDPGKHGDLSGGAVTVVPGDVTEADSVFAVARGHDAAISIAYRADTPPREFFVDAAHALLDGLARAGVPRLVVAGIGTVLQTTPGVAVHDGPDFPAEARALSLAHMAELEVLRAADTDVDWLVLAPPPTVLADTAPADKRYRIGGAMVLRSAGDADPFSYADLAIALLDEIDNPRHHRTLAAVALF